jgi:hypothetical protein
MKLFKYQNAKWNNWVSKRKTNNTNIDKLEVVPSKNEAIDKYFAMFNYIFVVGQDINLSSSKIYIFELEIVHYIMLFHGKSQTLSTWACFTDFESSSQKKTKT